MADDGMGWNKIVTLIFIISAMILLFLLVTMMFIMPLFRG